MPIQSLIIIGGGPGGYAAALEASRRKIATTLIERSEVGGTCLNRGCIPSKYFLSQGKLVADLASSSDASRQVPSMEHLLKRKGEIVGTLRQRMEQALKSQAVTRIQGTGRLLSPRQVEVTLADGSRNTLEADAILLAAGTAPVRPAAFPVHPAIFDSTTLLDIPYLPSHLVVLGGGYIGSELACAFQGLGSKVTLIEKEPRLLPTQPEFEAAGGVIQRALEKRGMTVWTGTTVDAVEPMDERRLRIRCSNGESFEANALLLALGRRADFSALGLASAGLSEKGPLTVNSAMQTPVPSIYAIGDLVSPVPLAHVASKEGEIAVAHMAGEKTEPLSYPSMPRCVYTWPEAAAVGLTETQAKDAGYQPRLDRYHFAASAKALVEEQSEGFWVIISDTASGKVLGGQIVGAHATELIHLIALSIKGGLTVAQLADTVFAHPSLSEGLGEAMNRSLKSKTGTRKPA